MSIKRAFSRDTYTVARLINIANPAVTRVDVEYKRGVGTVQPENLTSMVNSGGETTLLVNNNLYTKQPYPLVADDVQGYDSDYFMWTDIDNTARWFQATGWRDWSRNGSGSYQQVLGTYDAQFLDESLTRGQDLKFNEIDDFNKALGSMNRVVDLKMAAVKLPNVTLPNINITSKVERYGYTLDGLNDFLEYNALDTTKPDNQLELKVGDTLGLTFKSQQVEGGTGETNMVSSANHYITIPNYDLVPFSQSRDDLVSMGATSPNQRGSVIKFKYKSDMTNGTIINSQTSSIVQGVNVNHIFRVEINATGKLKITCPWCYTDGLSSIGNAVKDNIPTLTNSFNTVEVRIRGWTEGEDVYPFVSAIVNGTEYWIGTIANITNALWGRLRSLGATGTVTDFAGAFDGVVKDFTIEAVTQNTFEAIDTWVERDYDINEVAGIIVQDDAAGENGLRVNMDNDDITLTTPPTSYLLSGNGVTGLNIFINDSNKIESNVLSVIKVDGVVIDENTYVLPVDYEFHTITLELGSNCNLARIATDESESNFYQGILYDFFIKKGNQKTVWEFKTYSSLKQDPVTLTALSFGFNPVSYDDNKWQLIKG